MAPNRTSHTEVPSTPYNRPKQFDTARLLFKRMIEDQATPMPTGKLFAPVSPKVTMPRSPPLTPEDDDMPASLMTPHAPTPTARTSAAPSTPPPTLPRGPSTECPKLARSKRSMLFVLPPPPGASSADLDDGLGSPLQLAPVPFVLQSGAEGRVTITTPRKGASPSAVAPWAPKRPSFAASSMYGPRMALRKPFSKQPFKQPSVCFSSSAAPSPAKSIDHPALVGRINKLENLVRDLQRELAAQRTGRPPSSPTPATRRTRRVVKSSRPRPILADSVFL